MTGLEEQIELLKLIGNELKRKTECFIIGGSAMLFYGIKNSTKDIDIVFLEEIQRKKTVKILEKIGFYKKYFKDKDIFLLERKDSRLDLFLKKIMKFRISPGMLERKREVHEFGNLIAAIASPEDLILLKSATDREGDRLDAKETLDKFEINWNILLEEIKWQNKKSGKALSLFLYDFLLELKADFGINVPKHITRVLREINKQEIGRIKLD